MSPNESVPAQSASPRPDLPSLEDLAAAAKTLATINTIAPSTTATDNYCQYRGNVCANPRATKPNGERQAFCEFHVRQSTLHKRHWQRKQQTMLFRDPSRVPTALLRGLPQSITPRFYSPRPQQTAPTTTPAHPTMLPRLRSHDVLRRALLMTVQHLPSPQASVARTLPSLRTLERSWSSESRSSDSSPRSPSGVLSSATCSPYHATRDSLVHYMNNSTNDPC